MTCPHCLAEMPEVSVFCPGCGHRVADDLEPTPPVGRNQAILGALAYVLALPALAFLAIPALKSARFIRFHSWQSLLFLIATTLVAVLVRLLFVILALFSWVGFLLAWLSLGIAALAVFVLWVVLVAKAAQGEEYELPVIGPLAERLAGESL